MRILDLVNAVLREPFVGIALRHVLAGCWLRRWRIEPWFASHRVPARICQK